MFTPVVIIWREKSSEDVCCVGVNSDVNNVYNYEKNTQG